MNTMRLHGIFPPIPTPFSNDGVAYDKLASNIEKWSQTGIQGLVVLGSNGEKVYLSEQETRRVIATAVEAAPDNMLIIAGSGCESTQATIKLTNECADLGVHVALIITPHYYGGRMTTAALTGYYAAVADQAKIPILLYNVPKFTHLNLAVDIVGELSQHPNIVGIKDSSANVPLLGELINGTENGFKILAGTASVLFSGLTLGCVGGVLALANVAPRQCVQIMQCVQSGDFETAKALQLKLLPVNKAVTATFGVGGLKAALDMLGYFGGEPRLPLLPVSAGEKAVIRVILEKAGIQRSKLDAGSGPA